MHGGRFSQLSGNDQAILALNQQRHTSIPKITPEDAAVVASAVAENLDLLTGDKPQAKFVNHAFFRGWLSIRAHFYRLPSAQPTPGRP
jgi:hypothetical protein